MQEFTRSWIGIKTRVNLEGGVILWLLTLQGKSLLPRGLYKVLW